MKKVESYQAKDGKLFPTEEECQYHERHLAIKESFKEIKQYCEKDKGCKTCIYDKICRKYFSHAPSVWKID